MLPESLNSYTFVTSFVYSLVDEVGKERSTNEKGSKNTIDMEMDQPVVSRASIGGLEPTVSRKLAEQSQESESIKDDRCSNITCGLNTRDQSGPTIDE